MAKIIFCCLKALKETLDLESENLSYNSHSVFISFMTLSHYLDVNSLSFLICKMGMIMIVLFTSQTRDNVWESVLKTIKHNIHALLSRQLICVDCFNPVVPDKWGITVTDINSNKARVHDVIQQLLPHTDDIQTVHRWESTEAKDLLKRGFILCILECKAVLFEMSIVPGQILFQLLFWLLSGIFYTQTRSYIRKELCSGCILITFSGPYYHGRAKEKRSQNLEIFSWTLLSVGRLSSTCFLWRRWMGRGIMFLCFFCFSPPYFSISICSWQFIHFFLSVRSCLSTHLK